VRQFAADQAAFELIEQPARMDHIQQKSWNRLARQDVAVGTFDDGCRRVKADSNAFVSSISPLRGQVSSSKPTLKALRKYKPLVAGSDDGPQTKRYQRSGGLFTRRANAEIPARHQHVIRLRVAGKIGTNPFQTMPGNFIDVEFHVNVGSELVGVNAITDFLDAVGCKSLGHARNARGSAMQPVKADATTV
jgi:hypothetical protein